MCVCCSTPLGNLTSVHVALYVVHHVIICSPMWISYVGWGREREGACSNNVYHYENMSVQYIAISKSGKNDILRCNKCDIFVLFLLKT